MLDLVALTLVFIIAITFISYLSKQIEKRILFAIAFVFISIALFTLSFFIGGFVGMGLTTLSISLFMASLIALIVIVFLYKISSNTF